METLKLEKIDFFSHPDNEQKIFKAILTGLPEIKTEELLNPTQCYRCMLYGHGISQCMRYEVCSLCSGKHLTNTCTVIIKTTANAVYKCFNCVSANLPEQNHKATDPNCPYRAKYEQTVKNARDKNKQPNVCTNTTSRNNSNKSISNTNHNNDTKM